MGFVLEFYQRRPDDEELIRMAKTAARHPSLRTSMGAGQFDVHRTAENALLRTRVPVRMFIG